ncbi:MAG: DNA-3-methyladenine glycosylase [Actinomycetota bacterium]
MSDGHAIGRRLPRSFYARRSSEVAPDLLGRILVGRSGDGGRLAARIVETEAYEPDDPASHAFRGRTARNSVMFGAPGHLYVYFTYGMHFCMNAVTGRMGEGMAVLLRAAEPIDGLDEMRRRRGRSRDRDLCSGPAKLCQGFGIDRSLDGTDLVRGNDLWIAAGTPVSSSLVVVGPRVGIRVGLEHSWRFSVDGDPYVSRGRGGAGPLSRSARRGPSTP